MLQVETSPFGKAPFQANNIVGSKVLTKTTACKRAGTSTEITSTMIHMQMKTTFFKEIPTLIPQEKLPYACKLVKRSFLSGQLPNAQIAGRLKHFVEKKELLTKDHSILEIVKGHQIPFLSQPLQQQLSREIHLNLKKNL